MYKEILYTIEFTSNGHFVILSTNDFVNISFYQRIILKMVILKMSFLMVKLWNDLL
jgi:hypothetical protein